MGRARAPVGSPEQVHVFGPTRTGITRADGCLSVFAVQGRWAAVEPADWQRFEIARIDVRPAP